MTLPASDPEFPTPDWAAVVASLAGRRLLVVGDVMLDEYVAGDARRVCPEAPVPVVEADRRWVVPGGAANAAANVAALGGRPVLGGAVGDDAAGRELRGTAPDAGIDPAGLVTDPARPTTTKLRVLARGQQVIRVDRESVLPLPPEPAARLARWAERTAGLVDAVLLSDYGKGVLADGLAARVIAAARRAGRPVVVDPKGHDPRRYRGATLVKPNLSELADLTGRATGTLQGVLTAGQQLIELLPETTVLVTRGAEGMALFRPGRPALFLEAGLALRVFDVTGAGDTAAAALVLTLSAGWDAGTAVRVANAAAGVVVGKVGTARVHPHELLAALNERAPDFETALTPR